MTVLDPGQRKELAAQVRGRRSVEPARVPLARLMAEQLVHQRTVFVTNLGLGILFVGQWIASPSVWRAVLGGAYAVLVTEAFLFAQRDARRAQRFLDEHPVAG